MKLLHQIDPVPLFSAGADCGRRVCYYTYWTRNKPEPRKFGSKDIDTSLCTHLIYAFADLVDGKLAVFHNDDPNGM